MSNVGARSFVYDAPEAFRARRACFNAVRDARARGCTDALKYRIPQRAMLAAMQRHGPECIRDDGFLKEQAEAYPEIIVDPKMKEDIGAGARRAWGTKRANDCKGGKLKEMLEAAARGEKINLKVVIR